MRTLLLVLFLTSVSYHFCNGQEKEIYKIQTIAFYNLENLFDYIDDPLTFDNDRTPKGKDHWTPENYYSKLKNMARVLGDIGREETGKSPSLVGVCEIENRQVLEDLLSQEALVNSDYGIVHFDSPDRRGIDVALLFQKKIFTPTHYKTVPLLIYDDNDKLKRIFTRDQLVVSGILDGEKIHIIVNHWPSRTGGEARSRPKRIKAASLNKRIIDSLFSEDPYAKIITMGDLNDDPISPSIKKVLKAERKRENVTLKGLFNPMAALYRKGLGTLAWRDSWNLFDQIIISEAFLRKDYSSYQFYKAGIYNKPYLTNSTGQYAGYPFRSFTDSGFTGGYSDHFPVYLYLIKKADNP
jgi:hypothetical protein